MNLKLTKTKLNALKKKNVEHCVGGSESRYIQLTVNTGVKLFDNLKTRDYSYKNQKYAYVNGFGPELGQKFTIKLQERKFYCYITQHALPYKEHLQFNYSSEGSFLALLKEHNWSIRDLYPDGERNLGFCGNKIVCIDFGPLTREGIYL